MLGDVSLIAMGVSELDDETTIKVWISEREGTGQTSASSEHRAGDPRQFKVISKPFPIPKLTTHSNYSIALVCGGS